MTKVPASDHLDEIQQILDGYAAMMQRWRNVVTEAAKVGVEAKLNKLKTALWNLRNAYQMFEELDDDMASVESKIKKKGAALHAAKQPKKRS